MLTAKSTVYNNNHAYEDFCEDSVKIASGDSLTRSYEFHIEDTPKSFEKRLQN
jgi:hypothetical protein